MATRTVWLSSLLVGMASALAALTGAGLLLYDDTGVLWTMRQALVEVRPRDLAAVLGSDLGGLARASGALLATWGVALGLGLWIRGDDEDGDKPFSLIRGWAGLLVALALAVGFALLWESGSGVRASAAGQGLGLALTIALPAYYTGAVWRRLGVFAGRLGPSARVRQVVVGALLGLGAGSALASVVLGRSVLAVTAMLGTVVLASAGARILGWVVDRTPVAERVLVDSGDRNLRFAEWRTHVSRRVVRVLEVPDPAPGQQQWLVDPPVDGEWRMWVGATVAADAPVLFVGVASWFARESDGPWTLHEPRGPVRALAAKAFQWDDGVWAATWLPEPRRSEELPGVTVVADWRALRDAWAREGAQDDPGAGEGPSWGDSGADEDDPMTRLALSSAQRVWIRAPESGFSATLAAPWRRLGWIESRFRFRAGGRRGPPRLEPRIDEVVCMQRPDALLDGALVRALERRGFPGLSGVDVLPLPWGEDGLPDGCRR